MTANIISKLLGAVFKIPLTYIIHEEGMAIYNTAFSVYIMFLSFVISGMPFAVQKLTAESYAVGNRSKAKETVVLATEILAVVGLLGTLILWFAADFFALAMKEARAAAALKALSPSVFLVALGTAVKSGFQGGSDMVPTAVSQVIEALIKLFAGYFIAVATVGMGIEYAAAGAVSGVTVGEAVATAMLVIWYIFAFRGDVRRRGHCGEIINEISELALPMLFMAIFSSAISVCDTSVLRASLLRSGLPENDARFIYGAYTGYAMTVLNLPSGILATMAISIIPIISGASAMGNNRRVRLTAYKGIAVSAAASVAAAAVLFMFGEYILQILFHNTYSSGMLRMATPSVIFICIMQICGAILQSMGHIWRAFIAMAAAAVIKLICSATLAAMPQLNIYGAIIGTNIGFFVGMTINLADLSYLLRRT